MALGIKIFIILAFVIIRFAVKAARSKSSSPPPFRSTPQPPAPNMKQPPPYIPPTSQQQNPFQQSNPFQTPTPPPFTGTSGDAFENFGAKPPSTKSNMSQGNDAYYCKYCGKKFQSVAALKMDTCFKHPKSDAGLQKHELYTGIGRPNVGF